jgi:iron(II)-dependent oxidoreductase
VGDEFDEGKVNGFNSGVFTNTVGLFWDGVSPVGCLDMSGNVQQWTASVWEPEYQHTYEPKDAKRPVIQAAENVGRVAHGGSFLSAAPKLRGASRSVPLNASIDCGFRLCFRPTASLHPGRRVA